MFKCEKSLQVKQLHCASIITWSRGKNPRYNGPRYIHVTVVQINQNL